VFCVARNPGVDAIGISTSEQKRDLCPLEDSHAVPVKLIRGGIGFGHASAVKLTLITAVGAEAAVSILRWQNFASRRSRTFITASTRADLCTISSPKFLRRLTSSCFAAT